MEYKVVPFTPNNPTTDAVAEHLEKFINHYAAQGWNYVRLESVTTFIGPDNGCFGFGGRPGFTTAKQMVVFSK